MTRALDQLAWRALVAGRRLWPRRTSDPRRKKPAAGRSRRRPPSAVGAAWTRHDGGEHPGIERSPVAAVIRTSVVSSRPPSDSSMSPPSLLEASALVQRHGAVVDAFALEGIQGRLLEAAVGAGPLEEATPPAKPRGALARRGPADAGDGTATCDAEPPADPARSGTGWSARPRAGAVAVDPTLVVEGVVSRRHEQGGVGDTGRHHAGDPPGERRRSEPLDAAHRRLGRRRSEVSGSTTTNSSPPSR